MQDGFKFRVYDKDDNKMHDVIAIDYENRNPYIVVEWLSLEGKKRCAYLGEVPTVQCTGLKDKNGKLIYTGDIVKKETFIDTENHNHEPTYLDMTQIGVVYMTASNGTVMRKVKTWKTDDPYEEKTLIKDSPRAVKLVAYRSEVLGNIYETPELMEI